MKKTVCIFLILFLLFSFHTTAEISSPSPEERAIKNELQKYSASYPMFEAYMDFETGTLTLWGSGVLWDFLGSPWATPDALVRKIIISEGITGICESFSSFAKVEEVSFPKSLAFIYGSFKDCPSLEKVTFKKRPEWIESTSFDNGSHLKDILCDSTRYEPSAFKNSFFKEESVHFSFEEETGTLCVSGFGFAKEKFPREIYDTDSEDHRWYSLRQQTDSTVLHLQIEEGIIGIDNSFNDLIKLQTVSLPNTLCSVVIAFNGCDQLKELKFPASVERIIECGKASSLETLEFGGRVQVGSKKTLGCFASEQLKALYIPDGSYIYEDAFSFRNIETVVVGGPSVRFSESADCIETNGNTDVYCYASQQKAFSSDEKNDHYIHLLENDEQIDLNTVLANKRRLPYLYWGGVVLFVGAIVLGVFLYHKKKNKP